MQEKLETIENSSVQVQDMVNTIIGDTTNEIDKYISSISNCLLNDNILDGDLEKIIVKIPVYLYHLIAISQNIEMKKGISAENAKYFENDSLLGASGTVAEKQAKASNASIKDRVVQLAYKNAASIIQNKINMAMEILSSAKKVQQRRLEEIKLTKLAGNSVSAF